MSKSAFFLSTLLASSIAMPLAAADYPVKPVPFTSVQVTGGFWQQRQDTNRQVTIPFALEQCDSSKRLENFKLAADTMKRRAAGDTTFQHKPPTIYPFDDSDVYKVLEAASFSLSTRKDPSLEQQLDSYISLIAGAQEPDGYLYTFRTMHPDSPAHEWIDQKRWLKDPGLSHELYNIGHMYEAGVAHYLATGKTNFLDVCLKSAELVYKDFGDGNLKIAPGHQVIEMGLAKLYRVTRDERYLKLAKFFLDVRGPGQDSYNQRHLRVVDQAEAVGHAVRANYMYSGMADVAALTGDTAYVSAIHKIWDNVVDKKLHVTGGVGARANGEAYGNDYELPNNCYNETCAAIAFMMWNHRMFLLTGEAKYMNVFERTLYNGFLSGVSLSGDRFFYPNTLEYDGKAKNNHGFAGRAPWFGCACCPPNISRTLAALTGYFYGVKDKDVFVNVFAQSKGAVEAGGQKIGITQKTEYPWNGAVRIDITPEKPANFNLMVRLPGWVEGKPLPSDLYSYTDEKPAKWSIRVNGRSTQPTLRDGYLVLSREWKSGDTIQLNFPMEVRRVQGNEKIAATRNRVTFERGPIVYCFEGVDNEGSVSSYCVPEKAKAAPAAGSGVLAGATVLKVEGALKLDGTEAKGGTKQTLTAIPYALWNNRGVSPMQVWMPAGPGKLELSQSR